ncbi:hypothetical protein BaRGS_00008900 [Batillaria attramentaria]|uniref:Uncharacterized protein n=1 Tax=Batillaria attramentaria TaxID=370345 RepID=A0ABD0LLD6_9CAEN
MSVTDATSSSYDGRLTTHCSAAGDEQVFPVVSRAARAHSSKSSSLAVFDRLRGSSHLLSTTNGPPAQNRAP